MKPETDQPKSAAPAFALDSATYTQAPKFFSDVQIIGDNDAQVLLTFGLFNPFTGDNKVLETQAVVAMTIPAFEQFAVGVKNHLETLKAKQKDRLK